MHAVLSSLTSHIAVLDVEGNITAINTAWERFAQDNAGTLQGLGVGANYLIACERASEKEDSDARAAAAGIRAVLSGAAAEYTLEYPCHSPTENRWFLMIASPLQRQTGGAVVSHLNIPASNGPNRWSRAKRKSWK